MNEATLQEKITELKSKNESLKHRVDWLERQLFGSKSERFVQPPGDQQEGRPFQVPLAFHSDQPDPISEPEEPVEVKSYKRNKKRPDTIVSDQGLRFGPDVPVKEIHIKPQILEENPDDYDVMIRHHYQIAQNPKTYQVIHTQYYSIKSKKDKTIINPKNRPAVFEKSIADVSFLAMMTIDKFLYHLPLYRQHKRLEASQIYISRTSLTNWITRVAQLLKPIAFEIKKSILMSQILMIDETPIKAGRDKHKSKMKSGYFFPMLGDQDEIYFQFSGSKSYDALTEILEGYNGILKTDGNPIYTKYCEQNNLQLSNCLAHTRRKFEEAQELDKKLVSEALQGIQKLYEIEKLIKKKKLTGVDKRDYRQKYSKPIMDRFFIWCHYQLSKRKVSTQDPINNAMNYTLAREKALRLYLDNPNLDIDTNVLERSLRPIPMGKKNWLFCFNEVGAEVVGICQTIIVTCKMQGIDPYEYMVDVLQRIDRHPQNQIADLIPRNWKDNFSDDPLKSVIDR